MQGLLTTILGSLYLGGFLGSVHWSRRIAPHQPLSWHLLKAVKWPVEGPFE